ncbi:hypothetical protein K491DRAFT_709369 [Lophiostoma macrostomum CBS 122681]|uniref:NADH-ubiquinone oxidoreductase chain 2 n=1 Tax=Lophiostoma macrostomum CBS 122681 TaxID=1314788 RepID=A0A6A6SJ25_9PLEO|nr:hypothetical protein K491DRAFT_709369 [Lophiostoma macrostomum CBS 122681]
MGEQYKIIEYSLIILFIVTGSLFLISKLQSYGLYLLSAIYRDSESSTSGSLMYFLLGGLSSCFILLSTSLLYANSGTTNLDSLYIITSISNLVHYTGKSILLFSSLLSLVIGFILLSLSINTIESTQAFMFYLMQYSISNLNAFILIITIGYSLYFYININNDPNFYIKILKDWLINGGPDSIKKRNNLQDENNSPIQLIDQLRGYFFINPLLSLSLAITLFSFAGIPPLIGFFGKQMILSAAIDNVIKEIFLYNTDYIVNTRLSFFSAEGLITEKDIIIKKVGITKDNVVLSSSLSLSISIITMIISLFIFIPQE